MRAWTALVVGLLVALGTMAAAPATAATVRSGPVTLTTEGGFVAPGACQEGPPRFKLVVDESQVSNYDDWSADITITGPDGYYDTDSLWDEEGWNRLWFCKSPNKAGTYRVTADVEIDHYDDYSGYYSTYQTISSTLTVTGPVKSTVSYVKKTYRAHGWKFPVKVTRGSRAWAGKTVAIQMKCYGTWKNIKKKTTNRYGRVAFTATPERRWNSQRVCGVRGDRAWFRFHVAANWNTRADSSTLFHIKRR